MSEYPPRVYIIAEAACAANGNLHTAKKMIDVAVAAGCDAIKFQAFNPDKVPNITEQERKYLEGAQFNLQDFRALKMYVGGRLNFLLTPFDNDSIDMVLALGLDTVKVPSGRVTDVEFMKKIRGNFRPRRIIVSSGMLEKMEIIRLKKKMGDMKWLHCVSAYPAPEEALNLHLLNGKMFQGFSDHTLSTWVPAIAVTQGAKIIEKHFTMSRANPGPDQRVSLEPLELMDMVRNIRTVEKMIGTEQKRIMECEQGMLYRKVLAKKLDS